ncbi:SRPBCC family protein [Thalassobius sp. MITS945101]|uniref:SRPBCC family protein n=1 Tax=Thalassobius sp. MITS945101 TaxID=3096994 RepID=UPI003999E003
MRYSCTLTIDRPRDAVVTLFDDQANLPKWQKGLVSFPHIGGEEGKEGAVSRIEYKMGKREITMTETIVRREFPDAFTGIYEADGVWSRVDNRFEVIDNHTTHWWVESEFRCKGFLRLMAWLMPGMFSKQTMSFMQDFKSFVEDELPPSADRQQG